MKPARIPLTLRIPTTLKHRLERLARQRGCSINALIVGSLSDAVRIYDTMQDRPSRKQSPFNTFEENRRIAAGFYDKKHQSEEPDF